MRLTVKPMGRKLRKMVVVINSETRLTGDDCVLLAEDGKIQQVTVHRLEGEGCETVDSFQDEVRSQALEGAAVALSRVW